MLDMAMPLDKPWVFTLLYHYQELMHLRELYRAVTHWNMLPRNISMVNNKLSFKKKLKEAIIGREVEFS